MYHFALVFNLRTVIYAHAVTNLGHVPLCVYAAGVGREETGVTFRISVNDRGKAYKLEEACLHTNRLI